MRTTPFSALPFERYSAGGNDKGEVTFGTFAYANTAFAVLEEDPEYSG
jgi:hypothetical protein